MSAFKKIKAGLEDALVYSKAEQNRKRLALRKRQSIRIEPTRDHSEDAFLTIGPLKVRTTHTPRGVRTPRHRRRK